MSGRRKVAQQTNIQKSEEKLIKERARKLPLDLCYVNDDWKPSQVAHVIICRKHINGNLTCAMLLIDLALYGVKDVMYKFNIPSFELESMLENELSNFIQIPYNLAHNIVYAGLEWAEDFGFLPHKAWPVAQYVLEEDSDDIPIIEIECGIDGKPAIFKNTALAFRSDIIKLEETAGEGNFDIFTDESEEDDEFDVETDATVVEQILNDDMELFLPEYSDENFKFTESYFEEYPEAHIPFINEIHYGLVGQYYLNETDLIDFVIGEKDVCLEWEEASSNQINKQYSEENKQVSLENLIAEIKKDPYNRHLFYLLYTSEEFEKNMDKANGVLDFSKKVYNSLSNNLIAIGNYLIVLANHSEIPAFEKLLAKTDFKKKVMDFDGQIPELLFVYYCIVCAHEAIRINDIVAADKYYFASRLFIGIYDDPALFMFQVRFTAIKMDAIEKIDKVTTNGSPLRIVR